MILIGNIDSLEIYNKNKPINIVDVTFGKNENSTFMYVMDNLYGVSRFFIDSSSSGITFQLDEDFGFIIL